MSLYLGLLSGMKADDPRCLYSGRGSLSDIIQRAYEDFLGCSGRIRLDAEEFRSIVEEAAGLYGRDGRIMPVPGNFVPEELILRKMH